MLNPYKKKERFPSAIKGREVGGVGGGGGGGCMQRDHSKKRLRMRLLIHNHKCCLSFAGLNCVSMYGIQENLN